MTGERLGARGTWWGEEKGNLWGDDGLMALPKCHTRDEAEAAVARYESGQEYWCCGCEDWHPVPVAWKWWAGAYCAESADRVKEMNSRSCGICRRPLWDCSC